MGIAEGGGSQFSWNPPPKKRFFAWAITMSFRFPLTAVFSAIYSMVSCLRGRMREKGSPAIQIRTGLVLLFSLLFLRVLWGGGRGTGAELGTHFSLIILGFFVIELELSLSSFILAPLLHQRLVH